MERPDKGLRQLTVYRLRRASVQMQAVVSRALAPYGLRRTTFSALAVVTDHPGLRQNQLAETLAIERPNLVKIVDELEAARMVERRPADGDRRAYALHPTAKGIAVFRRAFAAMQEVDRRLLRGLSAQEVANLIAALGVIERNARGGEEAEGDS